jgi:hypothetical protein
MNQINFIENVVQSRNNTSYCWTWNFLTTKFNNQQSGLTMMKLLQYMVIVHVEQFLITIYRLFVLVNDTLWYILSKLHILKEYWASYLSSNTLILQSCLHNPSLKWFSKLLYTNKAIQLHVVWLNVKEFQPFSNCFILHFVLQCLNVT